MTTNLLSVFVIGAALLYSFRQLYALLSYQGPTLLERMGEPEVWIRAKFVDPDITWNDAREAYAHRHRKTKRPRYHSDPEPRIENGATRISIDMAHEIGLPKHNDSSHFDWAKSRDGREWQRLGAGWHLNGKTPYDREKARS